MPLAWSLGSCRNVTTRRPTACPFHRHRPTWCGPALPSATANARKASNGDTRKTSFPNPILRSESSSIGLSPRWMNSTGNARSRPPPSVSLPKCARRTAPKSNRRQPPKTQPLECRNGATVSDHAVTVSPENLTPTALARAITENETCLRNVTKSIPSAFPVGWSRDPRLPPAF